MLHNTVFLKNEMLHELLLTVVTRAWISERASASRSFGRRETGLFFDLLIDGINDEGNIRVLVTAPALLIIN